MTTIPRKMYRQRTLSISFVFVVVGMSALRILANDTFVPLREAADGLDLFIGAAGPVNLLYTKANVTYQSVLAQNYNLTTAENACKWASTEPQQGTFALEGCFGVRDFAQKFHMKFRGHNLCWGNYNPNWLDKLSPSDKRVALSNHISHIISQFNDSAFAWDVVNEAIGDSEFSNVDRELVSIDSKSSRVPKETFLLKGFEEQNPWGFKNSTWYPDVPDFVWTAFDAARASAPSSVKLFYNDYNIANANGEKAKRVYALMRNLSDAGLIDGVGFQMHVDVGWEKNNIDGLVANLKQYEKLGLDVHITEMDVNNTQAANDEAQADTYEAVLSACLNSSACKSFETWGFTDAHTWKGTASHPLPFNATIEPKASAWRLSSALSAAPRVGVAKGE